MTQAKLTDQLQIAYMQGKASAQREMMIGFDGAGNKPGEDGPYRPPDKKDVPGVPPGYPHIPKPTKLAAKDKDGNEIIPDGYDAITGMEWIYNKDGESEFIYPDDIIDLDKAGLIQQLMIAGDPSFTVGGSKGSSRNKKIMSSGDANAPNAKVFI